MTAGKGLRIRNNNLTSHLSKAHHFLYIKAQPKKTTISKQFQCHHLGAQGINITEYMTCHDYLKCLLQYIPTSSYHRIKVYCPPESVLNVSPGNICVCAMDAGGCFRMTSTHDRTGELCHVLASHGLYSTHTVTNAESLYFAPKLQQYSSQNCKSDKTSPNCFIGIYLAHS